MWRYFTPEPIIEHPQQIWARTNNQLSTQTYAYASNNPLFRSDPAGLYDSGDCKNHPGEEALYKMMERTVSVVRNPKLFACVLRQIENAHLKCNLSNRVQCSANSALGFVKPPFGSCDKPTKEINWCDRPKTSVACQAKGLIHEMAHTCGWDHVMGMQDGFGVPGPGGDLSSDPDCK